MNYAEVYNQWRADPEGFWMNAAKEIDWDKPPSRALSDDNAPLYEWFSDGMVNTCWNAVDRHVEAGRGEQTAIIYDSPITPYEARDFLCRAAQPGCHAGRCIAGKGALRKATGSSSTCR